MDRKLTREQLLAAEFFSYSYANYYDHLGVNERFDRLMPQRISILEAAERKKRPQQQIAEELGIPVDEVQKWMKGLREARLVVDAENPAEAFRNGVLQSIQYAVEKGLNGPKDIEQLAIQICYRASDLSYLLAAENKPLSRYSRLLRKEPEVEVYDGYYDEDDFA